RFDDVKLKWKHNAKSDFVSWLELMRRELPCDYPNMKVDGASIQAVNARRIVEVKNQIWDGLLIPASRQLLAGQMTPQYLVRLRKHFRDYKTHRHRFLQLIHSFS